jgi:uncharacterized Zn finger protein
MLSKKRDGIKAETEFDGSRWWTVEWLDYIEGLSANSRRIAEAKSCVKSGNVLEVCLEAGLIESKVQGNRKTPYQVRLYCELPSREQLAGIKLRLLEKAVVGASLLSGEMPLAVKEAFDAEGAALLPKDFIKGHRLCSCPYQENPCKHILAVLFVSANVIDRDPLLLLKMRGIEPDDLLASLLAPRGTGEVDIGARSDCGGTDELHRREMILSPEERHSAGQETMGPAFYGSDALPGELRDIENAVSKRFRGSETCLPMFDFPFWRGDVTFRESIEPYYESVREMLRGRRGL